MVALPMTFGDPNPKPINDDICHYLAYLRIEWT